MYRIVPKILLFYTNRNSTPHIYKKMSVNIFGEATSFKEIYGSLIYNCIIPSNWDNLCQQVHENMQTNIQLKEWRELHSLLKGPINLHFRSLYMRNFYSNTIFLTLNFKCVNNSEQTLKSLFQYHIMFP